MKTKTLLTLPMLRGITRQQRERPMFLSQDIIQKMRNSPSLYKHGLFRRKIVRGGTSADKTRRKIVRGGTSADKNTVKIVRGGTSADKSVAR